MTLAPGARIGPYEVLAPLGAGGMGEVFRARDSRLGREVAMKGLPAGWASDPDRLGRFEREARLLAALNHPGIATLFGLEEVGGAKYLVLELVEGESIAQRLARGPLPLREALDVGAQVAAALAAAHERDIVHRDLKPANVMRTPSGTIKVLDFGLAKSGGKDPGSAVGLSHSPTMPATSAGMILGTAAYMSPEQARGLPVDRRGDVWAFGCLLFECLSGRPVFGGETVSDVIARILEREPDWNTLPPSVPSRVRDLLRRCLTKPVEDRPRDLGDLGRELQALAVELSSPSGARAIAAERKPSLAVLYFENRADDAESAYFCTGITEDILTDLSKIRGLRVASRNAVQRYRGAPTDLPKVAAELGVDAVLEGSVRRAGNRLRITTQLVNAADGFQLWAERYDRTLDDVFDVQEEIASSIAEALRVALSPADAARITENRPDNVRAYDLYLKGRELYDAYNEASLRQAIDVFREATELDPQYALAWAGVADCYGQLCQWSVSANLPELTRQGLEAARRALAINPRLPEAHKAEALNLRFSGDRVAARAALLRAIEADPRFKPALINLTVEEVCAANLADAERYLRRVLEIDPQEAFAMLWLVVLLQLTRRSEEALDLTDRIRRASDAPFYVTGAHVCRAWIHLSRGDVAAAERTRVDGAADGARPDDLRALEAAIAAFGGRADEATRLLGELPPGGLLLGSLMIAAAAALRVGETEVATRFLTTPVVRDLVGTMVRVDPLLHRALDWGSFGSRRRDTALVWPLEAPMLEASVHALFREVRIESGLPPASEVSPNPP